MYQNVTTRSYRKGLFLLAKLFLLVPGTIFVGATTNQQISPILATATANHDKNQLPREFFAEEGEESPLTRRAIYCEEFTVTMKNSRGDGWYGNILYIGEFTLTLDDYESNAYATTTICLPLGVYTPYCCGGEYGNDWWAYISLSWSVGGLSGGADDTCSGTAGSFTVNLPPTLAPTFTPAPTSSPVPSTVPTATAAPTIFEFTDSTIGTAVGRGAGTRRAPRRCTGTFQSGTRAP